MADKEQVIKENVDHSGIWDFKGLYSYAHSWLKEEDYGVTEEKYSEKVSGNAREINFEWRATKQLSDYFKLEIQTTFEIKDLVEVEAEIDGKKKKTNKGKISVEIKGNLIRDPDSKWETSSFNRFMRDVYNRYIIPGRLEKMQEIVKSDVRDFKEQLKAFLELTGKR